MCEAMCGRTFQFLSDDGDLLPIISRLADEHSVLLQRLYLIQRLVDDTPLAPMIAINHFDCEEEEEGEEEEEEEEGEEDSERVRTIWFVAPFVTISCA
jgi:hypothetical protein